MLLTLTATLVGCLAPRAASPHIPAPESDTLRIAHLCDPQIGFGHGGLQDDLNEFCKEVVAINRLRPDLVVVAGDMVNVPDSASISTFLEAASKICPPVVYTPGNHDIYEPVTMAGLETYCRAFGPDFVVRDIKGRRLVSFNSLLLRGGPEEEMSRMRSLIEEALTVAKDREMPVILLSHVPPFAKSVDETDEYFNMPSPVRTAMLDRFVAGGVFLWLAGHTHTTGRNSYGPIEILNGENTSRNFDKRPKGFRLLTIAPGNSFTWEFVPSD